MASCIAAAQKEMRIGSARLNHNRLSYIDLLECRCWRRVNRSVLGLPNYNAWSFCGVLVFRAVSHMECFKTLTKMTINCKTSNEQGHLLVQWVNVMCSMSPLSTAKRRHTLYRAFDWVSELLKS